MKITSLQGVITKSQLQLFLQKNKKTIGGCWEWQAGTNPLGYGKFRLGSIKNNTRTILGSHRISYMLFKGDISDDLHVCHHCDNPLCVNPDHLWLGTDADNIGDKISKGRAAIGEKINSSKLTNKQVRLIRKEYSEGNISMQKLGNKYGICSASVFDIVHKITWKHVE